MKTILITGSSRGIGKAVAKLATERGWRVIVHGKTDSEALQKTHEEIEGSVKTYFDISDKDAIHREIAKLGKIDALVNNAGWGKAGISNIEDVDDEIAIAEYTSNVLGTLNCMKAVLPSMEKGDSIVSVSSLKGHPDLATLSSLTYAPSKAGILSLTKALAKVYPNIRINSVSPGYVATDVAKTWGEDITKILIDRTIMKRLADPREIATVVMFLISDDASYITGQDILVDGGYTLEGK